MHHPDGACMDHGNGGWLDEQTDSPISRPESRDF